MNTLSAILNNLRQRTPVGSIEMYAGSSAPTGWLLCDGAAISRTDYPKLFSIIGTAYGAGDGSTTFNLPDMSGRMPLGVSNTHPITGTGSSGGAETVTLTAAQTGITAHSHTYTKPPTSTGNHTLTASQIPAHTHGEKAPTGTFDIMTNAGSGGTVPATSGIISKATTNTGSYQSLTRTGNNTTIYQRITVKATHTHTSVGGGEGHNHGITNTSATTTGNPTNANASAAHNNMPPYRTVNFIIYAGK